MRTIEELESHLQTTQDKLDQETPIGLKNPVEFVSETLFQFLMKFFFTHTHIRDSIYLKNKRTQSYIGARRSATDLYRIFKNTFGDIEISLPDMIAHLHYMVYKGYLTCQYCWDVHKRVYYQSNQSPGAGKDRTYLFGDKTDDDIKFMPDNLKMLREDYNLLLKHHPVDPNKSLIARPQLTTISDE